MTKRIVQMLVTCATGLDLTRAEVREEIQQALDEAIVGGDVEVELVESRRPTP